MKISEIIFQDEYLFSQVDPDCEFTGIVTNISDCNEGSLLIIPNSLNLPEKINTEKTPVAVICDKNAVLPDFFIRICVENPRLALSKAYHRFHGFRGEKTKIIGITGTNGKSSTAYFIKSILQKEGYKTALFGTGIIEIDGEVVSDTHYSMTTPDPSLLYPMLKRMEDCGCDVIIMEVSSHALFLDKVAPLTFDYAVFTNLSSEHIDFHKTKDDYFAAKRKLFLQSKCAVFNVDDEYARLAYGLCNTRKISAGILWKGDVWATGIENRGLMGIGYTYHQDNFSFRMNMKTAGIYNAYNSMLAATVCIDLGCRPCRVKEIMSELDNLPGRYEIINDEISVIIDYAHTDSAFNNIMRELSSIKGESKLTVIFGCGGERDKEKRPKMAKIAEKYADRIIVTCDNPRNEAPTDIIADIIKGFEKGRYSVIEDRSQAILTAIEEAQPRDIVAVIGKGCEKYRLDHNGYQDYNERTEVEKALNRRKRREVNEN